MFPEGLRKIVQKRVELEGDESLAERKQYGSVVNEGLGRKKFFRVFDGLRIPIGEERVEPQTVIRRLDSWF